MLPLQRVTFGICSQCARTRDGCVFMRTKEACCSVRQKRTRSTGGAAYCWHRFQAKLIDWGMMVETKQQKTNIEKIKDNKPRQDKSRQNETINSWWVNYFRRRWCTHVCSTFTSVPLSLSFRSHIRCLIYHCLLCSDVKLVATYHIC